MQLAQQFKQHCSVVSVEKKRKKIKPYIILCLKMKQVFDGSTQTSKTLLKLLKSAFICGTDEILEINLKKPNIQNG